MATETDKIINPFKPQDIAFAELPSNDVRYGSEVLGNLKEMQVGTGKYAFYSDESGIWLGAKTFASAPFSVTMTGVLKATSGAFSGTITGSTITGNTISGGSISGTTITGSTLTTATSGQRVVLASTLASYYNGNNQLVASTYANNSGTFLIKGELTDANIYLDAGASGEIAFVNNGSSSIIWDKSSSTFYPATNNAYDLGNISFKWREIWGVTVEASLVDTVAINLNNYGDITDWSDIIPDLSGYAELTGATFSGDVSVGSNDIRAGGYHYLNSSNNNAYVYSTGSAVQIASGGSVALDTSSYLKLNGTQVVSTRKSSVTAPSGGATIDAEARTAINSVISRLESHGLIDLN